MTISHLSLVNQKLAYANAINRKLLSSSAEIPHRQKLEQQALIDAVIFHLATALHFYLRELAENYRLKEPALINTIADLNTALAQADKISSESNELYAMHQDKSSWLCQLQSCYDRLFSSPKKPKEKKSFGAENLIELIELSEFDSHVPIELTPELLSSWISSFQALIMRQRETSAEY